MVKLFLMLPILSDVYPNFCLWLHQAGLAAWSGFCGRRASLEHRTLFLFFSVPCGPFFACPYITVMARVARICWSAFPVRLDTIRIPFVMVEPLCHGWH